MDRARPILNQVNVIGSDLEASLAFYRRLGLDISEDRVWRTATGAHHITAADGAGAEGAGLDLDSATFAQVWNPGWRGRQDLAGRVVVGFGVVSRQAVDGIYRDMISAGYRGLQPPHDAFWGARYAVLEDPDGLAVGLMSPSSDEHRSPHPQV
jgi:catechol 2,3-dioxygenase-like lactoylglutathione lyase family enzyme